MSMARSRFHVRRGEPFSVTTHTPLHSPREAVVSCTPPSRGPPVWLLRFKTEVPITCTCPTPAAGLHVQYMYSLYYVKSISSYAHQPLYII